MTKEKKEKRGTSLVKEGLAEYSNVGSLIASSISFEEAYDLDLTDVLVDRLNSGSSIQQLQKEINDAFADRQRKMDEMKAKFAEQLDIALKITLMDDENLSKHDIGDPRF